MREIQLKSVSMRNLRNTNSSFHVPLNFMTLKPDHIFQDDQSDDNMNDCDKMRAARQSLHRYIFTICHTIQHFGHHLTASEVQLLQSACEQTLHWMWHGNIRSAEDYRRRIRQLLHICTPLMQRLFQAEQKRTELNTQKQRAKLFNMPLIDFEENDS